jgi:hypothetical protein
MVVERLAHAPRGQQVLRGEHRRGAAPGHRLACEQKRLGKIRAHKIDVVHGGQHGALLAVPALD